MTGGTLRRFFHRTRARISVVPAKAGTRDGVPACAGMTEVRVLR